MMKSCAALALLTAPALADSPENGVIRAEILPGWETPQGTQMAGLRLVLAPGWKTYWRAPGDAGIPPNFNWSGSDNLKSVATHWPRPEVFEQNGMRTIGYKHEVVLPLELTPGKPGEPIVMRGQVELGVCQDICMPMTLDLKADLPAEPEPAPIRAALADTPTSARKAGVTDVTCTIESIDDGLRLTTRITLPKLGSSEVAVVELSDPAIWVSEAQVTRKGRQLVATADLVPDKSGPFALDRSTVRITVLSGPQAVDIRGCRGN